MTLAEVAKVYQTFVSGKTYRFFKEGPPNQVSLIRRIEDRFGNTLYEPKRTEYQLVLPEFGLQMREILRRVVTHGTGRRARSELYLTLGGEGNNLLGKENKTGKPLPGEKRIRIPVFGKTGTTNDYNNANFAGFVPYPVEKGAPLDPENSYVLAAYAGYDRNMQMRAGGLNITGALGALPAWIGLAKEIIDKKKYGDMLDALDLNMIAKQEWPLKVEQRATPLAIDMPRGVIVGGTADQEAVATADSSKEGESASAASDEFRANVVETTINMPLNSGTPLRLFSPYRAQDQMGATGSGGSASGGGGGASAAAKDGDEGGVNMDDVRYYDDSGKRVDPPAAKSPAASSSIPAPTPASAQQPNAKPQSQAGQEAPSAAAAARGVPPENSTAAPGSAASTVDSVFGDIGATAESLGASGKSELDDNVAPDVGDQRSLDEEIW